MQVTQLLQELRTKAVTAELARSQKELIEALRAKEAIRLVDKLEQKAGFRDESNVTARRLAPDFGPHFAGTHNFAEGGVASVEQGPLESVCGSRAMTPWAVLIDQWRLWIAVAYWAWSTADMVIEISAGQVALLNNGLGMSWLSWLFWKITFIGHFLPLTIIIVLDSISGDGGARPGRRELAQRQRLADESSWLAGGFVAADPMDASALGQKGGKPKGKGKKGNEPQETQDRFVPVFTMKQEEPLGAQAWPWLLVVDCPVQCRPHLKLKRWITTVRAIFGFADPQCPGKRTWYGVSGKTLGIESNQETGRGGNGSLDAGPVPEAIPVINAEEDLLGDFAVKTVGEEVFHVGEISKTGPSGKPGRATRGSARP
ncbi:unnamed protein product [Cladocopium goreaui]|uniref:Uncharacterized protein n=1 Tax=Cladocopium goreaui TaxID=2562237 RepID=A0A9P1BUK0_9DINO|nr:unnamed protein product [Cladocopium goreaui]